MSISYTIEAKDLHKSYGKFEAVRGISFHVPAKSCFGLLGHNGQGKPTPLKMITALTK